MEKLNRLTEEDRANLVAYLDGELDAEQTLRIETILANNPVARQEVEQLARTYELLDELPSPKVRPDFTEKTVATARIEEFSVPLSQRTWFRRLLLMGKLGLASAAMCLCSFASYGLTNQWIERPSDQLLDHYPLIHRLDEYREVHSSEFLNVLKQNPELLQKIERETRYAVR